MSKGEERALVELLKDDSIVIRPADKGSGIVVLNSVDYREQLKKEVGDSSTYLPENCRRSNQKCNKKGKGSCG